MARITAGLRVTLHGNQVQLCEKHPFPWRRGWQAWRVDGSAAMEWDFNSTLAPSTIYDANNLKIIECSHTMGRGFIGGRLWTLYAYAIRQHVNPAVAAHWQDMLQHRWLPGILEAYQLPFKYIVTPARHSGQPEIAIEDARGACVDSWVADDADSDFRVAVFELAQICYNRIRRRRNAGQRAD